MEEIDLKQIFQFMGKKKKILIWLLIICFGIGCAYTFGYKGIYYKSSAKVIIDNNDTSIASLLKSKQLKDNNKIITSFDSSSKQIMIETHASSSEDAYNITKNYLEKLNDKLKSDYNVKKFNIIQNADKSNHINLSFIIDLVISLIIGVALYMFYIFIIYIFGGYTNKGDIEKGININILGIVPLESITKKKKTKKINIINNIKSIVSMIEFNKDNIKPKTILFTGVSEGVGNTYLVNKIALEYAKIYKKVLVIDTDIYSKKLSSLYKLDKEKGISNLLIDNKLNINSLVKNIDNINILPVGTNTDEEELFLKNGLDKVINDLKNEYDIILIDSLSVNNNIIPIQFISLCDATILICEELSKRNDIVNAKEIVNKIDGKLSGIIINKKW